MLGLRSNVSIGGIINGGLGTFGQGVVIGMLGIVVVVVVVGLVVVVVPLQVLSGS